MNATHKDDSAGEEEPNRECLKVLVLEVAQVINTETVYLSYPFFNQLESTSYDVFILFILCPS